MKFCNCAKESDIYTRIYQLKVGRMWTLTSQLMSSIFMHNTTSTSDILYSKRQATAHRQEMIWHRAPLKPHFVVYFHPPAVVQRYSVLIKEAEQNEQSQATCFQYLQ